MATVPEKSRHRTVLIYEFVTGGGLVDADLPASWEREGNAMRRALVRDFASLPDVSVLVTLDSRLPLESSLATTLRVRSSEEPVAHARHVDHTVIVAPESAGILTNLAGMIPNSLGCTAEAIALTGDKLRFFDHLTRTGIATPPTLKVSPRDGLPPSATYPAVLKPIDGAGSVDTLYIESCDDPHIKNYPNHDAILQPYIKGEPRSASFLVDASGEPHLLGVCRQGIVRDGEAFHYQGGTLLNEGLPDDHPAILAVKSMKGLRGWVGVDYIQEGDPSAAIVIELNPRATTSCVAILSVLSPGRLAAAWLDGVLPGETWPIAVPSEPLMFRSDGTILSSPRDEV